MPAARGGIDDEPVFSQRPQRLQNRLARHIQRLGKLFLRKPRSRRQFAVTDRTQHTLIDLFRQAGGNSMRLLDDWQRMVAAGLVDVN